MSWSSKTFIGEVRKLDQKRKETNALLLPSWLEHRPLVTTVELELNLPNLNDNTGDLDRLTKALKAGGYDPIHLNPLQISRYVAKTRQHQFEIKAVLGNALCHWDLIELLPPSSRSPILGIALDLGTSSLAFYLVDLNNRKILKEISTPNPQIGIGEDILTRILFSREDDNKRQLQHLLLEAFNQTVLSMLSEDGFLPADVYAVTVAGNTTMSHLLLGLDATTICKEPYIPAVNRFPFYHARDLDLRVHPDALVYIFPNVGSYFGGDLIAGILASGMHHSEETSILVDVGTNAEVVLGNRDWLIACAGAAGPALEGGVVERGMMAAPGAIDRIRIDPGSLELSYHVIGEGKPRGICGSGLIDLVAEMFNAGILTIQGKINRRIDFSRIVATTDGPGYVVVQAKETLDERDLVISEIDIGIFLKSKAAMYTILTVIANKVGLHFEDLKHFYVAGTFGNYIDPSMAIRIGMIPDLPLSTYQGMGNTAGCGAVMLLLDRHLLEDIERVCSQITYVELNVNMELMNEFRGALFIPHTDPKLFPSVQIPERALGKVS